MSKRLADKCAVITGGGRGIGKAIAKAYVEQGARCVITARNALELESTAREFPASTVVPLVCDVSDQRSVEAMARAATDALGAVDIVVNNAGMHASGQFVDIAPEVFAKLFEVNVLGIVRVSQAFLPAMIERGGGRIINMASTAGLFESPGQSPYNTSKHAAVGLTRCMALELAATGVTINAICPGFVDTALIDEFAAASGVDGQTLRHTLAGRTPMGRILVPEEVAHLAVYLGSDESASMTGQTMVISNAMRMH